MTLVYDKNGKLKCNSCGSYTFDMVAEMRITEISRQGEDPVADRTIESENVISLVCARCGVKIT